MYERLKIACSIATGTIYAGTVRKKRNDGVSLWNAGKRDVTDMALQAVLDKFSNDIGQGFKQTFDGKGEIITVSIVKKAEE